MKIYHWLFLSGLLLFTAAGCASYHGPAYTGSANRLPPSYWDNVGSRTSANVFDAGLGWDSPFDRNPPPVNYTKLQ